MTDIISINTQSSIRIAAGALVIYIDPIELTAPKADADLVFLTHDHHDHFSPDILKSIMKEDTFFVVPTGMMDSVRDIGVEEAFLIGMRPGNSMQVNGVPVEAVAAYNIGKPFHPKENDWLGYILTLDGKRYYIAGDTDATPDAKAVQCDVAIVPIGGHYTMDYKEAAALINEMKPSVAIPTHYGSIIGTPEDGDHFAKLVDGSIEVVLKLTF